MSLEDVTLREALRAEPRTDASERLRVWLEALDDAGWGELHRELSSLAARVAAGHRDVVDEDEATSELLARAYDRWIPAYVDALREDRAEASLSSYLERRLKAHLAELRRKRDRRARLMDAHVGGADEVVEADEISPERALFVGYSNDPHAEAVLAQSLEHASKEPELRKILALRYAGFNQREIAELLRVSRPTVSRRIAALAVTLGVIALVAIAVIAWPRAEPTALGPETPTPTPPTLPAGGGEPVLPVPAPDPHGPLSAEEIRRQLLETDFEPCAPAEGGRVEVRMAVGDDGAVRSVEVQADLDTASCIDTLVREWRFRENAATELTFPLVFPEPEDAADGPEEEARVVEPPSDSGNPLAEAQACAMQGNNECVIRTLRGRANSPAALALLIETYRRTGDSSAARAHMQQFVNRFPSDRRAQGYNMVLRSER